ncbi:MAG: hypothetical protein WEB87_01530, partial [Bacteriovoracaceae bacterium]
MLQNVMKKFLGTKQDRDIKEIQPLVQQINSLEDQMKKMSDEELKAQTNKFRALLEKGSTINDILPEAFATAREASVRVL